MFYLVLGLLVVVVIAVFILADIKALLAAILSQLGVEAEKAARERSKLEMETLRKEGFFNE